MRLVVLEGPTARPTFEILQRRTLIGRAPDCDVLVYDAQVSRHHAQILRLGDAYVIESLQAANPAIVNDRMTVERRKLSDGDLIVLGTVVFQVDLPPQTAHPDDSWSRDRRMPGAPAPVSDDLDPEDYQETPGVVMPQEIEPSRRTHENVAPPQPRPLAAHANANALPSTVQQPKDRPSADQPPTSQQPPAQPLTAQQPPTAPRPLAASAEPAPQRSPREQLVAVAVRLGAAGQRLQSRVLASGLAPAGASVESDAVTQLVAEHERLGGDTELARLAVLLSERLGNQTDIRALYRLGAEAAELGAWTRLARQSVEEAIRLAEALGVHRAL
ncbi:MAG: FHA domain-containing protein [Chloroflexi bacterium]|nr:FHA domain-containing protein [Chloroflexota bacterium]